MMTALRCLLALLLMPWWAQAAEELTCHFTRVTADITANGRADVSGFDVLNLAARPNLEIFWDDPAMTSGNFSTVATNGNSEVPYNIPASVGSVSPRDGAQHTMYMKMVSLQNPGAGDVVCEGSPWPFKFTSTMWPRYTAALPQQMSRGITPATLAVIANTNDAFSVGSSGTTICTVAGTPLKDDGAAGYYINKYKIPCGNARVVTVTKQYNISQANFASQILPTISALPASIQGIALAWAQPSFVDGSGTVDTVDCQPNSVVSMVASGGIFYHRDIVWATPNCFGGDMTDPNTGLRVYNPLFNSTSVKPFTDTGYRPTMHIFSANCTSGCGGGTITGNYTENIANFKTMIDHAFASRDTNPFGGNVDWAITSDAARRDVARSQSTLLTGSGLTDRANTKILGSVASPSSADFADTNVLFYLHAISTNTNPAVGTLTLKDNGSAYLGDITSTAGCIPDGHSGLSQCNGAQTPLSYYLGLGAVGAHGNVTEPSGGSPHVVRNIEGNIFIANYAAGANMMEALWKSVLMTDSAVFAGDPLAAPFQILSRGTGGGSGMSMGGGVN